MTRGLLLLVLAAAAAPAASTRTWEMNTFNDFLSGRFAGVSLSRDGRLRLAPKLHAVFSSEQPAIWSVAHDRDGNLYLGTGHHGRLYRVDRSGKAALVWTADEPEVFAVAVGPKGPVYAATSPNGKVYRIENDKAAEYFSPGATYIWSLAVAPDGALFVGTGDDGRVYRVIGAGSGELYYETGQSHVTCLAFDTEGRLLAGTEPNGILYRISAKDKAFVLYDATHPEIRAVAAMPDGAIFVAALGGSVAKRAAAAPAPSLSAPVAAPATSITVTAAQGGVEIKPKPEKPKVSPAPTAAPPPAIEITGVEKSALYKIYPDHTVETLWTSTEENAYDLLVDEDALLFTTDARGRVYELAADRKVTLVAQTDESEAIRLLRRGKETLIATGNMGKIYHLSESFAETGSYEAPVHDAGGVARWGRLSWKFEPAPNARVEFQTRSGNTARPDRTWSEWSAPLTDADGSAIPSPNARYIQWKATLTASGGRSPVIDSVTLAYLPQNISPRVTSIDVSTRSSPAPAAAAPQSSSAATYSITVTDTGGAGPSTLSGTATQKLARAGAEQIHITWQAEDADGDRLVYSLFFRGDDEREWKLMKGDLEETSYALDANTLADGKYFFRVVASDRLANPSEAVREGELVSAPVLIDQTPPAVRLGEPRKAGNAFEVEAAAVDAASALRSCEYSLNAGRWIPLASQDGIIDSREEEFLVRLLDLPAGEHLLVVRVFDSAGNAGLARAVIHNQ